jgi:hypothetical protein
MRVVFLEVPTYYAARKAAPWATVIAKVTGGYKAFESIQDYETWRNQK